MRQFIFAALAASAAATPATAQDTVRAPFTGPRAEAIVGWDHVSNGTGLDNGSSDGVVYGGQIGYDVQAGSTILGLEGEVTGASTDISARDFFAAGDQLTISAGRDLYVGGRLGFLAGDRAMIYAKGGYTNARINTEYRLGNTTTDDGVNLDGFRVGGGAEFQLSSNMYLKGEYRYSRYDAEDDFGVDYDRHQVVGGIGIRF